MNAMPDSFVVNPCQYTPVYLIQDSGASQVHSYFIAQSNIEEPLQVTDNLKAFYESSGSLENNFVSANNGPKPRILKKPDSVIGNNLKLASFLQPKNETLKQQYLMSSMILKPNATVTYPSATITSTTYANSNTRLNIDSKIVKLKDVALKTRVNRNERAHQPKSNKPKDVLPATLPVTIPTIPVTVSLSASVPTLQVPLNAPSTSQLTTPVHAMNAQSASLPSKHTSVQLLKLGETYHSLNELSADQMKMVTQALQIFSNPEKKDPESSYDPITNTNFIYKVVSPKDLAKVGKNKTVMRKKLYAEKLIEKNMTNESKKEATRESAMTDYVNLARDIEKKGSIAESKPAVLRLEIKKDNRFTVESNMKKNIFKVEPKKKTVFKSETKNEGFSGDTELLRFETKVKNECEGERKKFLSKVKTKKHNILLKKDAILRKSNEKFVKQMEKEMLEEQEAKEAEKVTRSGRKVKLPRPISPQDTPHKPKKKNVIIPCFQCSDEFNSLYRLHKHYESHPTHIPSKIHSNLFHCLLAIVNGGAEEDRTNIFIQQLEQLIVKLRSMLPCLLRTSETGRTCNVSKDVGNLLGIYAGRYSLDMEALDCVKNTEGYCRHMQPPAPLSATEQTDDHHVQNWTKIADDLPSEIETDDCARINSVEKWPTVVKRVWKKKRKSVPENAKRMRLNSENNDTLIELGIDDFVTLPNTLRSEDCGSIISPVTDGKADSPAVEKFDALEEPRSMSLPQNTDSLDMGHETDQTSYLNPIPVSLEPHTGSSNLEQIVTAIANLEKGSSNHLQFHSAHFDIRSSPIKPTSTVFRKFQINPELLAKCETQIMQSIETVDKDHKTHSQNNDDDSLNEITDHLSQIPDDLSEIPDDLNGIPDSLSEISQNFNGISHNLNGITSNMNEITSTMSGVTSNMNVITSNNNGIRNNLNEVPHNMNSIASNLNRITNSLNGITNNLTEASSVQISETTQHNNEDSTDQLTLTDTQETLHQIFREEDLSKESFTLDRELKDWILNRSSNEEKSEDGFDKSNTLIEPSLIHVKDHEIKTVCDVIEQKGLPSDNHDESSVLNFLDTLGNDCLSYPGTEIRTNGDFQLDLFSFHSS